MVHHPRHNGGNQGALRPRPQSDEQLRGVEDDTAQESQVTIKWQPEKSFEA